MSFGSGSWNCPFCGRGNPPGSTQCSGCGGVPDHSPPRGGYEPPPPPGPPPAAYSRPGPYSPPPPYSYSSPSPMSSYPARAPGCLSPGRGCGRTVSLGCTGLMVFGLVAAVAVVFLWTQKTHEEILSVTGRRWERSVEIERLQTVTEEAWEGSVPSGARRLSSWTDSSSTERVRVGSRRVRVGTRDRGDGSFEEIYEDQPVYENRSVSRTKVRYEIDRWVRERTLTDSGSDASPRWPAAQTGPNERERSRREVLQVLLRSDSGQDRAYAARSMDEWLGFTPGARCKAQVNNLGTVTGLQRSD